MEVSAEYGQIWVLKTVMWSKCKHFSDHMAGPKSFLYGKSTTNQKMEAWWSFLRKHSAQYWMDILHTLKEDGLFSGDVLDKNLVQLCFLKRVLVVYRPNC